MKEKRNALCLAALVLGFSLFNLSEPVHSFSSKENRYLQTFPEVNQKNLLSGKFSTDFEIFTTDQFIGRDAWISLKTLADLSLGKKDNGRVYFGKQDFLFDASLDRTFPELDKNIRQMNQLAEEVLKKNPDTALYSLFVPSKEAALQEWLPAFAPVWDETGAREKSAASLSERIQNIDSASLFAEQENPADFYYRTDHHWTSLGSFYAYQYFLESTGKEPLAEGDFNQEEVSDDFYGTLYRKANFYTGPADRIFGWQQKESPGDSTILINEEKAVDSYFDDSFLKKIDQYAYFLGGNHALMKITTAALNGRKIAVIKDSFANSFLPFLAPHYEKIIVIDPRYFGGSTTELLAKEEVDEVLFLFSMRSLAQEKMPNFSK